MFGQDACALTVVVKARVRHFRSVHGCSGIFQAVTGAPSARLSSIGNVHFSQHGERRCSKNVIFVLNLLFYASGLVICSNGRRGEIIEMADFRVC